MFVTKWLDLGKASMGFRYESHVDDIVALPWWEVTFDAGSICAAFQGTEEFDVDSDAVISLKDTKELFKGSPFS